MLCGSNYATDKETRNSLSGFVATLVVTVTLSITEAEYVALTACAQEVNL